jgi:hypothetical protein
MRKLRRAARIAISHSDAPRAPVIVPAGMMPEPPGCGVYLSARGEPHSLRRQGVPSQTASLKSEISGVYCRRFRQVKGVGNFVDKTIRFVLRSFEEVRGTPMIRIKRANFRVVVFPRRRAIQQNQNALVNSG